MIQNLFNHLRAWTNTQPSLDDLQTSKEQHTERLSEVQDDIAHVERGKGPYPYNNFDCDPESPAAKQCLEHLNKRAKDISQKLERVENNITFFYGETETAQETTFDPS